MALRFWQRQHFTCWYCLKERFCKPKVISNSFMAQHFTSDVVPSSSQWVKIKEEDLPPKTNLSLEEVRYMENLALVQYEDLEIEKRILDESIRSADILQTLDTNNVEPLYTLLEDESLYLRDDIVTEEGCVKEILKNAKEVMEDYFVAPPGNVTLSESKLKINHKVKETVVELNKSKV